MKIINTDEIKKITEARKIINDLQLRLLSREQALDDLVRVVEIAEITHQFHMVSSFKEAAEQQLQDRIVVDVAEETEDLKIRIYE
jgi:hypothetical protein